MSAVDLRPYLPRVWTAEPRPVEFGADLTPALGGTSQRAARLGDRHAVSLSDLPSLDPVQGRKLLGALARARKNASTVKISWPQPRYRDGLGTPKVNGASQAGTSLLCDGFTPSKRFGPCWFSMTVSSVSYLYMVDDEVQVDSTGAATLPIAPMLRASPADNTDLEFANPVLEGFLQPASQGWRVRMSTLIGLPQLEIVERA